MDLNDKGRNGRASEGGREGVGENKIRVKLEHLSVSGVAKPIKCRTVRRVYTDLGGVTVKVSPVNMRLNSPERS